MKLLIKNLIFTLIVPGTVGGYLPIYLGRTYPGIEGWWNWFGIPLVALGCAILAICIWDFGQKGEGTPLPLDAPKKLVVGRLYRLSRNPMYLGVLTLVAGWGVWFSNFWLGCYWLLLSLVFNLFVRYVEEPALKKQFGEGYLNYCQQVSRWF